MLGFKRNRKLNIAILDDDQKFSNNLKKFINKNFKATINTFKCGNQFMNNSHLSNLDIVIVEHQIMNGKGKDIVKKIIDHNHKIKVIVVSIKNEVNTIIELIKHGAHDFISKSNIDYREVKESIEKAYQINFNIDEILYLKFNNANIKGYGITVLLMYSSILKDFANSLMQHL